MSTHPIFEVVTTTTGALSIKNKIVNEIMHNPVGPWAEANNLYVDQSALAQRLSEDSSEEFVIFDVGLGAASNALAALHCHRQLSSQKKLRSLKIISFEKDLDLLRFALTQSEQFEHFRNYPKSVEELLEKHLWKTSDIQWELRHGDFLDLIEAEKNRAHLIFYDPYSPQVNTEKCLFL